MSQKHFFLLLLFAGSLTAFAQSAKKLYNAGEKFRENLSYQDAINSYTKSLEMDPKYIKSYQGRAACYEKTGKLSSALEDYKRALVFAPQEKELFYNTGRLNFELGKYAEADPLLRDAINKDKYYNEALEYFIRNLLMLRNFQDASDAAELWLENKKTAVGFYYHAVVLDSLQNYLDAEKEYKQSKYYDANYIPAYVGLMLVENKLRKFAEAITVSEAAIAKEPNNRAVLFARSIVNGSKGDYLASVNDISKVIASDPNNEDLFMRRAGYYEKLGQFQNAIYDYSKVIGMNSKNVSAFYRRAWNYEQVTSFKLAAADYEKIMALAPGNDKAAQLLKGSKERLYELNRENFKPEIELLTPKASEKNVIRIPQDKTEQSVKGKIKDASLIKSITLNNLPAKYDADTLNPDFSATVQLGTGNELTVTATDIYDNKQKLLGGKKF